MEFSVGRVSEGFIALSRLHVAEAVPAPFSGGNQQMNGIGPHIA